MSGHCVHCGLTISNFLDLGKFGCPTCHEIFLPNKLKRVPTKHRDFLESLHDLRFLKKINWTDISFRLRVARCFRKGFFPFYSRLEDRARELLVQKGFVLAENGLETVPLGFWREILSRRGRPSPFRVDPRKKSEFFAFSVSKARKPSFFIRTRPLGMESENWLHQFLSNQLWERRPFERSSKSLPRGSFSRLADTAESYWFRFRFFTEHRC